MLNHYVSDDFFPNILNLLQYNLKPLPLVLLLVLLEKRPISPYAFQVVVDHTQDDLR